MQITDGYEKYTIYTLIDITRSGIITPKNDPIGFHQEQNLNTFLQILGFRTQVLSYSVSSKSRQKLENYEFGNTFNKTGKVWTLSFSVDSTTPWKKDENYTYWLFKDFQDIPVHTKLKESAKINPEIIDTRSLENKNICFEYTLTA